MRGLMQGIRDEVAIVALQLGIDFGTTRTAVACADRGNYPVVTLTDAGGDDAPWIPTVVAERDGELRYGLDAAAVAGDPSFSLVRSFKRLLGSVQGVPARPVGWGVVVVAGGVRVAGFLGPVR